MELVKPSLEVYTSVLPGGALPERMTEEAIGYDVRLRSLVDPFEMDEVQPLLRKTVFDFEHIPDQATLQEHITHDPDNPDLWAYELRPNESVLGGTGFATSFSLPYFFWITPRSGLSSRYGINLGNAPGTVDADYRGEAGVIIRNESDRPFILQRGMRIAQIVFCKAEIVKMHIVKDIGDLPPSARSAGGFGSTGIM